MSRRTKKRIEKRNNTPAYDTYFANVLNTPVVNAKLASSTWRVGYRLGWWEQVTDLTYNLI